MLLKRLTRPVLATDFFTKHSRVNAALSLAWLCGILIVPILVETAPLAHGHPATPGTAIDSSSLVILAVGICLLLAPRYERLWLSGRGFGLTKWLKH